ncbi:MAG TPA: D-xylose ABC transporter ATP-binding protein, partial [Lachnoclostridium sp.]|nr:D-xylose ABC transporter ATP-binding protein [Lachnoclostridium sp.]
MSEKILLQMKNIHKSFPGVKALTGVDLELRTGEVHALLGENGAGKSTLIKVLGGIYKAEEGEIFIDGHKVIIDGVNTSHANGISIIHQELVLVPHMTVAENIFLGREPGKGGWINHEAMEKEAQKLLDDYHMNIHADTLVKNLTIAQQQMVEIVKAISYHSKILVMDEPTSSISDKEVEFLFKTMRVLTKKGVGIIYISHKMDELEQICDRVTVLRDGAFVGTEVVKYTTRDKLIAMMVGRELTKYYTRDYLEPGEVVLKCENIADGNMVKGASFELCKGEIIGFAGLVGAGRSEAIKCIFGLTPGSTGKIFVEGREVKIKSPVDAMKYGIA